MSIGVGASDEEAIDPRILREAAVWLMRLQSGSAGARERARLAAWRSRDPEHERAWLRAEQLLDTVGHVPAGLGTRTLSRLGAEHLQGNRRDTLKLLTLLLAATPVTWLAFRASPWRNAFATWYTATGERREVALADNSLVTLNTDSAMDVDFDAMQRVLVLRRGEILVATAPDTVAPPRPFLVTTEQGRLHALGTRFQVRQLADRSRVSVFEGSVDLHTLDGARRMLNAGEQVEFTLAAIDAPLPIAAVADGWSRGILYADNQRLADFLAELSRYRPGVLRCDPAIADLRISGAFQIADTDKVLTLLAKNHSLRIEARTRWWVSVHAA